MRKTLSHPNLQSLRFERIDLEHAPARTALHHASFSFPTGIVQIRGKQESGVSALLECLCRLRPPVSGSYYIDDLNVYRASQREFLPYRRAIGCAFDNRGLIHSLSLLENLSLPLLYHYGLSETAATEKAVDYLEHFAISGERELRPSLVSRASVKFCLLARAFLLDPVLLVLDEPTRDLSEEKIPLLVDIIHLHQKEHGLKSVILVCEDSAFLSHFSHHTVHLSEHRLTLDAASVVEGRTA